MVEPDDECSCLGLGLGIRECHPRCSSLHLHRGLSWWEQCQQVPIVDHFAPFQCPECSLQCTKSVIFVWWQPSLSLHELGCDFRKLKPDMSLQTCEPLASV